MGKKRTLHKKIGGKNCVTFVHHVPIAISQTAVLKKNNVIPCFILNLKNSVLTQIKFLCA